jgi:hypothetical protein
MADDSTLRRGYPFSRSNPDAGSRVSDTDPLSELARLIGQTKPFGDHQAARANGRDNDWPGSPAPRTQPLPLGADYRDDEPRYESEHQAQGHDQHHHDQQTDYGQHQPEAPYYGDNGQLAPADPYAQPQYDDYEDQPPRRRSGLITVVAVICLALLGTAGAYTYRTFLGGGMPAVPPLIKADAGPNKVPPAQQSGEGGANKQIYDRLGSGGQAEKIVSREEQPVVVKPANARPAYVPGQSAGGTTSVGAAAGQLPQAWPNPPGATVQQPNAPQTEPRKVRTVTIRPDQPTGLPPSAPPAAQPRATVQPDAAQPPVNAPTVRPQSPPPARATHAPLSLTPQGAVGERSASAEPRMAVPPAPAPVAASGGSYVVQLSAQKTEGEASAAFRAAQARYPALLGSRQLILRRKEIAGRGTFYGAQVGPFAGREGANQLCEELKSAGGTCIVQKN